MIDDRWYKLGNFLIDAACAVLLLTVALALGVVVYAAYLNA